MGGGVRLLIVFVFTFTCEITVKFPAMYILFSLTFLNI